MSGTAIAQAIPVLISPILSRLYTPEDFGVLALFMSIAAVLGVIATGRYELAIMLPQRQREAYNILALSLLISLGVAFATLILVSLFKKTVALFFEEPSIEQWLFYLPLVILFAGVFQAFSYWSTRNKTFTINATGRISRSSAQAVTNLGMGFAKTGALGLISGFILGQFVGALVLAWKILKNPADFRKNISLHEISHSAKKYRNFFRINTPHAFIDSLQENGIIYLILYYFTKSILGSYSFAYRIIKAPVSLIGGAIYQVFYQKASEAFNAGENLRPLIVKIYLTLFIIGFPLFLLLFLFTPEVFIFVFGEKWSVSGEIAQILIPWIFLNFLANPVSFIAIIMNKQKEAMYFTIANILLKVISIVVGGSTGDYRLGFIILSATSSILMIFALIWYYRIAKSDTINAY